MRPRRFHLDVITDLEQLSKRDLIALVYEQQRTIADLKQQVQALTDQLQPPKTKPSAHSARSASKGPRAKRPGRKPGHPGRSRLKPTHIDRVVEQTLSHCPQCHEPLGDSVAVSSHVQEDLIPARVEVTEFQHHRYYCAPCQQMVTAPPAPEELPHSRLGPQVLTQLVLLRYVHGLPFNKIQVLFGQAGLRVSQGACAHALQRLARWLQVEADALLTAIRGSPATHVDETGWKLTGVNHWLWAFVTEQLAYYRIDRSRGSRVPKEVLGPDYDGIVLSDFYSAYNRIQTPQQKCWVHLLRELRKCAATDPSAEYRQAQRRLRRIFLDARRLARGRATLSFVTVLRRHRRLEERLLAWGSAAYHSKTLKRLAARILKHHHQLLTFLEVPGLPWENNQAERLIRPHVILRNRSYQSRSDVGMATHATLMSLVQTLTLQGRQVGNTLREAYLRHRQGDPTPSIFSQS